MPQSAEQHGHEQVDISPEPSPPAAAQRDVDIIPKPAGQADVPAPPEIRGILRQIGHIEIPAQVKIPDRGDSNGHVGIAGKVTVDLQRVANHRHGDAQAIVGRGGGEHRVHRHTDAVGKDHLLGQAGDKPGHAQIDIVLSDPVEPIQLGQKVVGLDDGAGGNLGEEGDVSRQLDKIPLRGDRALLHIQQVAHGLKQIEGNTQWQNDVQRSYAAQPKGPGEGGDEEIAVFAQAQQGQAGDDAAIEKGGLSTAFKPPGTNIAHPDDPQQKQQEADIPVGIEHGVGQQKHPMLSLWGFAQLHQRGSRQKEEQKIRRIKGHTRFSSR